MKKTVLAALFLMGFITQLLAQSEFVEFRTRKVAPLRKFIYHLPSNFDAVNGKINIAINSSNGYTFEINQISIKNFKCGARLKGAQFKVVLIDNLLNKTYLSNEQNNGILTVNCLSDGIYELIYSGEVYKDNSKINVTATLSGKINHSRNMKTN